MKEEYLTVKELQDRMKYSTQSIYNMIHNGTFQIQKHYLKPTPKKILFKWSAILEWMGEKPFSEIKSDETVTEKSSTKPIYQSAIVI